MNTKFLGVIVGVILLIGAGGLFLSQKSQPAKTNVTPTPTKSTTKSITTSLLELITQGKNQRCTFNTKSNDTSTTGTMYFSSGNVRGDFKTVTKGKETEFSMIRNGDINYIWGSSLPMGIKMKLSLDELSKNSQTTQYVNPSQKIDYNCMPWNADKSLFIPPSNVEFTEIPTTMLPKTTGTTNQTSACDSITDPAAKASCVKALSGN